MLAVISSSSKPIIPIMRLRSISIFSVAKECLKVSDNDYYDDKILKPMNSLSDALALSLNIVSKL